jgi:hypothetical protein
VVLLKGTASAVPRGRNNQGALAPEVMIMVDTEREILREKDEETRLGERKPFESSRQAEYEDSVTPANDWEYEDS